MSYTLNQSVNKFLILRQQLRQIIGKPKQQTQSRFKAKTAMAWQQGKEKCMLGMDNTNKQNINRQQKSQLLQQTQRKVKKGQVLDSKYCITYLEKSAGLINSKEQILDEINELLSKKQQILSEIQNQMMKQSKISQKQTVYECSWTMPEYFDSQKTVIKAPNLSNIRQERKKMRKKSLV